MITNRIGIVIGRFQPFHNGHVYLIHEALKICDKIIIGIGSSNVSDKDNPYTFEKRLEMVEKFIEESSFAKASADKGKIIKVVPIPDVPDDEEWLKITLKNAGKFDVSFGNNDWVNGIFKTQGIDVVEFPFYKRYLLEGKKIRELMRSGKSWQDRVPLFISEIILGI